MGGTWQEELEAGQKRALVTSLTPLRVHARPTQQPRPPTLEECEVIIEQLYSALSLQSEEVSSDQHCHRWHCDPAGVLHDSLSIVPIQSIHAYYVCLSTQCEVTDVIALREVLSHFTRS